MPRRPGTSPAAREATDSPDTSDTHVAKSARELRRLIGARELSPVELLEACIARIERLNPFVNAITATCFERARDEARLAEQAVMRGDPLGLLHGLPFGLQVVGPFRGDLRLLAASHALGEAFASRPELRRPRPDPAKLRPAEPALDSIVTAPPDDRDAHRPTDAAGASVV